MVSAITNDIAVSVESSYLQTQSKSEFNYFLFSYKITITNNSNETVQLLKRHWEISDSFNGKQFITGEGVVGLQPVIEPGQSYQYESYCQLKSSAGSMSGFYTFLKFSDDTLIEAEIPEFVLLPEYRNN